MFERGLTIFRVRGIAVRLDLTLLVALPYLAFVASSQYRSIAQSIGVPNGSTTLPPLAWGVILAVALFVSVLVHELAHALVALRSGGEVRSITLMMLGGITRMGKEPPLAREAWMAFAGPLTSWLLSAAGYGLYRVLPLPPGARAAVLVFAATNFVLGAFNLIPAFPMDGGRILRSLLSRRMGRDAATEIAARMGKFMAGTFALLGLLSLNWVLVLIAWVVYTGASTEQWRSAGMRILRGMPVGTFMNARLGFAYPDDESLATARRLLNENLVAVRVIDPLDPHHTLGIATARELAKGGGAAGTLRTTMRSDLPTLHPNDDATSGMDALASGDASALVVVDEAEDVVGLVLPDDLSRAMTLGSIRPRA